MKAYIERKLIILYLNRCSGRESKKKNQEQSNVTF